MSVRKRLNGVFSQLTGYEVRRARPVAGGGTSAGEIPQDIDEEAQKSPRRSCGCARNWLVIGPPCVGKAYLATGRGAAHAAAEASYRTFFTATDFAAPCHRVAISQQAISRGEPIRGEKELP